MIKYRGLSKEQQGQVTGLDTLNPQIKKLSNRVQSGNVRRPQVAQQRLQGLRKQRNDIVNQQFARGEDGTISPTAPSAPTNNRLPLTTPGQAEVGTPAQNTFMGMRDILFPGQRQFENKDFESSPLYQFRRDEAMRDADRLASSRGLLGSGAEIEMRDRALARLTGEETDRASLIAQKDADRYYNMIQDEARFREGASNEQFDRAYQLMQLAAQQNPLDTIYSGATNWSNIVNKIGGNKGKFAAQNYARPTMGVSPYTGGASLPPFIAPFPSGPNTGMIDAIASQYQGNFMNDILSGIGGLFG